MRLVAIVVFVALCSVANAQPGETPVMSPAPAPAAKRPEGDGKDPGIAVLISIGVPVAGALTMAAADSEGVAFLGFAAVYLGPSTGRWYAGEFGGGTLGLRTLGGVSMFTGLMMALSSDCDFEYDCSDAERRGEMGALLFWGGAGLWVGTTIADIAYAKRAADKWNKRHGVAVGPTLVGANRAPGFVLSGSF